MATTTDSAPHPPKCTFGLITDVQYADVPNCAIDEDGKTRYYRDSLKQLRTAISHWSQENPVEFVVQLGDLIDGKNNKHKGGSERALRQTLDIFDELPQVPIHHVIGNHELYNFSRDEIIKGPLNSSELLGAVRNPHSQSGLYYHFTPIEGLRIVILDTYEMSVLGIDKQSEEYIRAYSLLRNYNKNTDIENHAGLPHDKLMYVAYNGGVSENQLNWLEETLAEAQNNMENIILIGHQGIHSDSSSLASVCWNYDKIYDILQRYSGCVLAYICGHDHEGGYAYSDDMHFISLEGVIETEPQDEAFATVHVYPDRVDICGVGRVSTFTLHLKNTTFSKL